MTQTHVESLCSVASLTLTLQDNYGHMNMCHHALWMINYFNEILFQH